MGIIVGESPNSLLYAALANDSITNYELRITEYDRRWRQSAAGAISAPPKKKTIPRRFIKVSFQNFIGIIHAARFVC